MVASSSATATSDEKGRRTGAGTRRRRQGPTPNSILDKRAVRQALDDRGIQVKPVHFDGFYQALHRQHYPDLPTFVENYYRNERKEYSENSVEDLGPLKNKVGSRKNRNKQQLPKPLLEFLQDPDCGFVTVTSKVAKEKTSADGMTTKLAVQLHDGQLVESVLMRYVSPGGSRASLCVSSQCGCAMGCTFCATGTMGLSGNLTSGEILEQMVHANRILAREWKERWNKEKEQETNDTENEGDASNKSDDGKPPPNLDLVRNVVFMGMGEPLDNYTNVVEACKSLIDRKQWNLAHGRVTVSTVGLVSQIRKLTKELPEVALALSLHAPNQAMRTAIVPTATRYPIESLIEALDGHMMFYLEQRKQRLAAAAGKSGAIEFSEEERIKESSRRRAMIEYVMLEGDTSTFECAHQLGKLCENRQLVVNLIPYNQTDVKDKLKCPSREHMEKFKEIVSSYGTFCTIRRTMGADIDSACGQLLTQNDDEKQTSASTKGIAVRDIEDAAPGTTRSTKSKKVTIQSTKDASDVSKDGSDLDRWIVPLATATAISAAFFLIASTTFLFKQKRR